jgi:hypothetical protein
LSLEQHQYPAAFQAFTIFANTSFDGLSVMGDMPAAWADRIK